MVQFLAHLVYLTTNLLLPFPFSKSLQTIVSYQYSNVSHIPRHYLCSKPSVQLRSATPSTCVRWIGLFFFHLFVFARLDGLAEIAP